MKEQRYELRIIDKQALDVLSQSPQFKKIENGLKVSARTEIEARQKADKAFPMCDTHDVTPGRIVPDYPDILGKYPDLWKNEKLTSCKPIIS